jgi:hypothetical protein
VDLAVRVVGEADAQLIVDGPFERGVGAGEDTDDVFEPRDLGLGEG